MTLIYVCFIRKLNISKKYINVNYLNIAPSMLVLHHIHAKPYSNFLAKHYYFSLLFSFWFNRAFISYIKLGWLSYFLKKKHEYLSKFDINYIKKTTKN